mgnify:CR=1 FL=1
MSHLQENNIRAIRIERGMTQPEVVRQINLPFIDVPLLSKFENGVCVPTWYTLRRLASVLNASVSDLYGMDSEEYARMRKARKNARINENFEITDLIASIPYGKANAIRKRQLMDELDVRERKLYKLISEARQNGYLICATGKGFYLMDEETELRKYLQRKKREVRSLQNVIAALEDGLEEKFGKEENNEPINL